MSRRKPDIHKSWCGLCDSSYDDRDAEQVAIHEHPEPQSGEYRQVWIASKLPYDRWIVETNEGRQWSLIMNR